MSSVFMNVLRQAFKTFDRANQSAFTGNFTKLQQLMGQLTLPDMHLNQQELCNDSAFNQIDHAPCTFLHIFENDLVSLSVFVMRGGYTMPLHDHPMMHGVLRGLSGTLRVQSYTQRPLPDQPLIYDKHMHEVLTVAEPACEITPNTGCAILTPSKANFHEITAIGGVAAFFDILSPPYDVDIPEHGSRKCRFYRTSEVLHAEDRRLVRLERIRAPLSYYCDTAETPDQLIQATFNCCAEAYSEAKANQ